MARAALKKIEDVAPQEDTAVPGAVEEMTLNQQDPADLDAMFSELENELETAGVNTTGLVIEHSEEDQVAAGQHITTEKLRAAALEELEENAKPHPDEAKTPAPKAAKKAVATKRISTLGLSTSQALAQGLGAKLDELLTLDVDDFKLSEEEAHDKRHALLADMDKTPKKVGEKIINLYASIAKGATLSTYSRIAIELIVKEGELTSKTLKDRFCIRYAENTASSQCTQMMKLLPLLGIAKRDGAKLTLNQNSLLVPMINTAVPGAGTVTEPEAE